MRLLKYCPVSLEFDSGVILHDNYLYMQLITQGTKVGNMFSILPFKIMELDFLTQKL